MEFNFDFTISGITEKEADNLLDLIILAVELAGGQLGGGFTLVKEDDDDEERPVAEDPT